MAEKPELLKRWKLFQLGIFFLFSQHAKSFGFQALTDYPVDSKFALQQPGSEKQPPVQIVRPKDFFDARKNKIDSNSENSAPEATELLAGEGEIKGVFDYYLQTGAEVGFEDTAKCEPSIPNCAVTVPESRHLLNFEGLIGWGPLVSEYLYFTPLYRYSHNWTTDYFQEERFFQKWFSSFKTEDFIVPTKQMVRNHEFSADIRGLFGDRQTWFLQSGLYTKLVFSRLGSKAFGEALEISETIYKTENFVPYLIFKIPKVYRISFYMPFKTEINNDDQRFSQRTYNLSSKGRGFSLSPQLTGEYVLPNLRWLAFAETGITESKVASIQNDKRRITLTLGLDIPLPWKLRTINQVSYFQDKYLVDRVRNKNFTKDDAADVNEPAVAVKRSDSTWRVESSLFYQFAPRHHYYSRLQYSALNSSLVEFNQSKLELIFGYKYSLPNSGSVQRKSNLFSERDNVEDI
jgi:hypothetical protein